MNRKWSGGRLVFTIIVVSLLLPTALPGVHAATTAAPGLTKGLSYKPVIPLKKVTFVNYDENSTLDDYAYLAAVPTCVFPDGANLISSPLLFYQEPYHSTDDEKRTLNARQGLDYFMDDWMTYCNGQLDQMTLINVPADNAASTWNTASLTTITGADPYTIANQLALHDWSHTSTAVVAVIQPQLQNPSNTTTGSLEGSLPASTIGTQRFSVDEPVVGTGGTYKYFNITDESYKYVVAKLSWPNPVDYDLQLYDTTLGMVDNAAQGYPEESVVGYTENVGSYIHNHGKWGVSVTAVPVKSINATIPLGDLINESIQQMARSVSHTGTVDLRLYPGTMIKLPPSPFGCRDVDFTLSWNDPGAHLDLTLLDPSGTEICSSLSKEAVSLQEPLAAATSTTMHVDRLGECRPGENYSLCVFALNDLTSPLQFTVQYSWHQNFSRPEAESFASATNGAVLASTLNAPLLYASPEGLTASTTNTLQTLGVTHIYLINVGGHLPSSKKPTLNGVTITAEYADPGILYRAINAMTGNNRTSVFTTIDPWTYWYVGPNKPAGEYPGALFVGPASFIAAQHGSPVLIVDLHPLLSQATVYPTDFWVKTDPMRSEPTSASMLMSGREVYRFLEDNGLGKLEPGNAAQQHQEILITVADQYDIGAPWDRMFTGAALNGRFAFSPVDTAYYISREVFYPALIYVNPAMQGDMKLINGSSSTAKLLTGRLRDPLGSTLVITKPSQEETYSYPILETFNTYAYRFNEQASKYWNFKYTTADGIIPYDTPSQDPIDDGSTDKGGAYYPDMSESEVVPFYAHRAGYGSVFSTSFEPVVNDLNRGVLIWVENCHGWQGWGGVLSMWNPSNSFIREPNPWRAYEPITLKPGHVRDFLRWMVFYLTNYTKEVKELIKFHLLPEIGSTSRPDVAAVNTGKGPMRLNRLLGRVGFPLQFWGTHGIVVYWNNLKRPLKSIGQGLPLVNIYQGDGKVTISPATGGTYVGAPYSALKFDDALQNLHSCGLNTISCLVAYTYLQMTFIRHGMSYQIMDPWTTTDWAGVWTQMLLKEFAMGDTIGEAYEKGMRACGPEFLVGQWWWDKWENVELFGDPCLRVYVPSTQYSSVNNWPQSETTALPYDASFSVDGHMPFGTTVHPQVSHAEGLSQPILIGAAVGAVVIIAAVAMLVRRRTKK